MKLRYLFCCLFCFWALLLSAQEVPNSVVIYQTDGTEVHLMLEKIRTLSFLSAPGNDRFEAVDLGLSVDWASVNVDVDNPNLCALAPEEPGGYYGWGDPTGDHHEQPEVASINPYMPDTTLCLVFYGGDHPLLDITGTEYDIARQNWGGDWRLPTRAEQDELRSKCQWTMETRNGMNGYKVTGLTGKSIFLPAAGFRMGNDIYFTKSWFGYYWSGSLNPNFTNYAYSMDFTNEYYEWFSDSRYYGQSVRPVRNKATLTIEDVEGNKTSYPLSNIYRIAYEYYERGADHYEAVDLGLSVKWAAVNVDLEQYDYAATSPEAYGGYYGWADPTGTKTSLDENDYPSANPPMEISGTEYDLITQHWGAPWRLPKQAELEELRSKCSWEWATLNGTAGYKVTGPNGNNIFLPAAGWRYGTEIKNTGTHGFYWSGSRIDAFYVYDLGFNNKYFWNATYRYNGFTLRGVRN